MMKLRRCSVAETGLILQLVKELDAGSYNVGLTLMDNEGVPMLSTIQARVCHCSGQVEACHDRIAGVTQLPLILGILAGLLMLLSEFLSRRMETSRL